MKISARLDYACRVLAELGRLHGASTLASIDHLARAEQIPSNFLAQILSELRNAGLITSRRGIAGGYALARPPEQISLLDIINAVEGDLLETPSSPNGRASARMQQAWADVRATLAAKTRAITLDQLVVKSPSEMYYI